MFKLIYIFGHILTINSRCYGRCFVKILIPLCTFLKFHTDLEINSARLFQNDFNKCSRVLNFAGIPWERLEPALPHFGFLLPLFNACYAGLYVYESGEGLAQSWHHHLISYLATLRRRLRIPFSLVTGCPSSRPNGLVTTNVTSIFQNTATLSVFGTCFDVSNIIISQNGRYCI